MSSFKNLSKNELIKNFDQLVQNERKLTAEVVEYIKEIDSRKIYLDLGFSSMFKYLTEGLGYTAASAQRRIDSARLLRGVPEIKNELETGSLNLMELAVVAQSVRAKEKQCSMRVPIEDKKEILEQVQRQNLFETQATVARFWTLMFKSKKKYELRKINRSGLRSL